MRLSTANLLAGRTSGQIAAPAALTYPAAALCDGIMATPYRTDAAATSHRIAFDLGAAVAWDFLAAFDVRALNSGVTVSSISAAYSTALASGGFETSVGSLTMNSRGDGSLALAVPVTQRYVVFTVTLSASSRLQVGEMWVGRKTDLRKTAASKEADSQHHVVVNGDFARVLEPRRERFTFDWSALDAAEHGDLVSLDGTAGGEQAMVVLVPDETTPAEVYLGRVSGSGKHRLDPSQLYQGHGLGFLEARRCHGA